MHALTCEVSLPISRERVYHAWAGGWAHWLADADSLQVSARAGAPFFFEIVVPVGEAGTSTRYPHYGRYLELVPHERVRLTWVTGPLGTGGAETVLTITLLREPNDATRCILRHEGFATSDARARHEASWPHVLAAQSKRLASLSDEFWQQAIAEARAATHNRSVPDASFIPTRSYPDLDAAVEWLVQVLGCRERLRVPGERVQLTLGNGAVVVAAWNPSTAPASGGRPPATLVVRVADVDAAWARALATGATGLAAPQTRPDGERQATVRDPAGHAWALTQTVADVDPAEWGGVLPR